jgi:hypothetical protein
VSEDDTTHCEFRSHTLHTVPTKWHLHCTVAITFIRGSGEIFKGRGGGGGVKHIEGGCMWGKIRGPGGEGTFVVCIFSLNWEGIVSRIFLDGGMAWPGYFLAFLPPFL